MAQMMATLGVGFVAALNIYSAVHWVIITGILAFLPGLFHTLSNICANISCCLSQNYYSSYVYPVIFCT